MDFGSYQTDYVKSAHALGLPVAFLPFSWDNLTNRGLIRVSPDRVLVWNDVQKREAIELHGVPADRVVVTGAPRFDSFFDMRPSTSRDEFCSAAGLDPSRRFVLYLCSSQFVAPREVEFVHRWVIELRKSADPALASCGVLVRPHPAHAEQWADADLSDLPGVRLWRARSIMNADQGLFDSLHHASAVVSLNTSALIEAGILGKPVHTIVIPEFAGGQEQTLHFEYLRSANAGLLAEARDFEQHRNQLAAILNSDGAPCQRSLSFVQAFVRPHGLDRATAPIMVDEIERLGRMRKRPQGSPVWSYPLRWALLAWMAARPAATARKR